MKFNHVPTVLPELIREDSKGGHRTYLTPNGKKYPSVTTILAEYNRKEILEWRKRVGEDEANKISRMAAKRGAILHKIVEMYLNNEDISNIEMMPNVKSMFFKIKKELDLHVNNIYCSERALFSHELQIAGTADFIAEYDGVLTVFDLKSSNKIKNPENIGNYFMQTVAYREMFHEMTGMLAKKTILLIGVEGHHPVQKFITEGADLIHHKNELIKYIDLYYIDLYKRKSLILKTN